MTLHALDIVVLNEDLVTHGLKRGDLGTVVHVYSETAFEVEFVTASGRTHALVTLPASALFARSAMTISLPFGHLQAAMLSNALPRTSLE